MAWLWVPRFLACDPFVPLEGPGPPGSTDSTEMLSFIYGRALGPFRPLGGSSLATELVPVPSSTDGPDSMLSLQALARNFLLRNNLISLSEPSPQEEGQDASFTVTPRVPRYNALL